MARLLFVHAHPDDETLASGVTMAHHVAAGDEVIVLTCTLGDEGEVIPAELAHHTADRDDTLASVRREELSEAMTRLGVAAHLLLGAGADGMPRYRDSGMAGTPSARHPRAFVRADLAEAGALVAQVIDERRPDVVVTYDRGGGYEHPDHIQTRRVTEAGLRVARWEPPRCYEILTPLTWAREDREWVSRHVPADSHLHRPAADEPFPISVVPDHQVSHLVIDPGAVAAQVDALRAHRTQVTVFDGSAGPYYALSNDIAHRLPGREGFGRFDPRTGQRLAHPGSASAGLLSD